MRINYGKLQKKKLQFCNEVVEKGGEANSDYEGSKKGFGA